MRIHRSTHIKQHQHFNSVTTLRNKLNIQNALLCCFANRAVDIQLFSSALTRNAQRQSDVILAQLCAQNELVRLRLFNQMPAVGDTTIQCQQAGRQMQVQLSVRPTPNPSFRRVDAQVFSEAAAVLRVSTIVGRY